MSNTKKNTQQKTEKAELEIASIVDAHNATDEQLANVVFADRNVIGIKHIVAYMLSLHVFDESDAQLDAFARRDAQRDAMKRARGVLRKKHGIYADPETKTHESITRDNMERFTVYADCARAATRKYRNA